MVLVGTLSCVGVHTGARRDAFFRGKLTLSSEKRESLR